MLLIQEIVLLLLEGGANIDQKNAAKQTPIFLAIEANHRSICHVRHVKVDSVFNCVKSRFCIKTKFV